MQNNTTTLIEINSKLIHLRMRYDKQVIGVLLVFSLFLFGFGIPKNIQKKVSKEIVKIFEVETFSFDAVAIPEDFNTDLPAKIGSDNLFKISNNNVLLGYAFIDQAPSKTAKFDYLVVFDKDLKIIHSKILIYREEYGGEIGSKRWLRQFLGKTVNDRVDYESNIDSIAGATISVRSMTNAIDNILQTIDILKEKGVL